jgi:hypothetical protein
MSVLGYPAFLEPTGEPRQCQGTSGLWSPSGFRYFKLQAIEPISSPSNTPEVDRQYVKSDAYQEIGNIQLFGPQGSIFGHVSSNSEFTKRTGQRKNGHSLSGHPHSHAQKVAMGYKNVRCGFGTGGGIIGIRFNNDASARPNGPRQISSASPILKPRQPREYYESPLASVSTAVWKTGERTNSLSPGIQINLGHSGLRTKAGWEYSPFFAYKAVEGGTNKANSKWASADSPKRQRPSAGLPTSLLVTKANTGSASPGNSFSPMATAENNFIALTFDASPNPGKLKATETGAGLGYPAICGLTVFVRGRNQCKYWMLQGSTDGSNFIDMPQSPGCNYTLKKLNNASPNGQKPNFAMINNNVVMGNYADFVARVKTIYPDATKTWLGNGNSRGYAPGLCFINNDPDNKGRGWPKPIGIAITESPAGSGIDFTKKGKNHLNAGGSASPTHKPPVVNFKVVPHGFYQGESLQKDVSKRAGPWEKNPRNYDGGTISGAEYVMIQNNESAFCPRATVPYTEQNGGKNSPRKFYLHIWAQNAAPPWNTFAGHQAQNSLRIEAGNSGKSFAYLSSKDNQLSTTRAGRHSLGIMNHVQIQNSPFYTSLQIPNSEAGPIIIKKKKTDRMLVSESAHMQSVVSGNKPLGVLMTPMGRRSGM